MTTPAVTAEELAQARRRMQAVLLDSSGPLPKRIEEFRRLLRESQLCAAHADTTWSSLLESF